MLKGIIRIFFLNKTSSPVNSLMGGEETNLIDKFWRKLLKQERLISCLFLKLFITTSSTYNRCREIVAICQSALYCLNMDKLLVHMDCVCVVMVAGKHSDHYSSSNLTLWVYNELFKSLNAYIFISNSLPLLVYYQL